jgi:hypothetical protein
LQQLLFMICQTAGACEFFDPRLRGLSRPPTGLRWPDRPKPLAKGMYESSGNTDSAPPRLTTGLSKMALFEIIYHLYIGC